MIHHCHYFLVDDSLYLHPLELGVVQGETDFADFGVARKADPGASGEVVLGIGVGDGQPLEPGELLQQLYNIRAYFFLLNTFIIYMMS